MHFGHITRINNECYLHVVLCGFVNRSRQKESTKRDRWEAFVRMVYVLGVSLHDDGRLPRVRNRYRSSFITVAVSASGYQTIRSKKIYNSKQS